ncbi:MAG: glucose 1-dehydrogenase [Dehalococcoidales bacterium]|nr:glucose 1-dehydrogenase [Dehalococcoidales bacterium]
MGRLDNKVAIITGAGMGMGQAGALLFAREGAKIVVVDWDAAAGEETVKMIKDSGGEAIFVKADVSKAKDVENAVKKTIEKYGKLNIMYNNAAIIGRPAFTEDVTEEEWDKVMSVNLKGVWLGMKYAIPEMLKGGGGTIINTASQCGERATRNLSPYCTTKGGVLALTRITAMELAKKNIRVNALNPGIIATPMALKSPPEEVKAFEAIIPQGRLGKPEEVAYAALFLASDESSHVTGHALVVDGGIEIDNHQVIKPVPLKK